MSPSKKALSALALLLSASGCSPQPARVLLPQAQPPIPANLVEKFQPLQPVDCPKEWMTPCTDNPAEKCPGIQCLVAQLFSAYEAYYQCQARHSGLVDAVKEREHASKN